MKRLLSQLLLSCCLGFFSASIIAAPKINAYDIYNRPYHFSLGTPKWIVINYWATWCQFCVNEIPELNKLADAAATHSFIFFGVNFDNASSQQQRAFAERYHMRYLLLRNNPFQHLLGDNPITTLPTTFIISPEGHVQVVSGELQADDVLARLH